MPLRDTLNKLREQQREQQDRPALIAEWRQAVDDLLIDIRKALSEYEQDGSLTIKNRHIRLKEETVGTYETNGMEIQAGPVPIIIQPVGRFVSGAEGRVDMHRQGRPSEDHRVMLLRQRPSGPDSVPVWFIDFPPDTTSRRAQFYRTMPQKREVEPFSKHALERAIDMLLS